MVRDNPALSRFELESEGAVAFSAYRRKPGVITFTHTEVPEIFRGKGVGGALARGALELVRKSGDKVIARCPFIAGFIEKHAEYQELLL